MLFRGCGFAEGSPEISLNPGSVLDQEGTAHCSQVKAALLWCKDPHLWRVLEGNCYCWVVGDRPQLPPLWPFHMCDTGHCQGQEPGFLRCVREWGNSLHCPADKALNNQLLGNFLEEML